jgi:cation diffusion facilitator CzcD-associated flavoprotein CzcO
MPSSTNGNATNGAAKPYQILEQTHSARSKWKIICVGAGASGLYLAYSCEKRMKDYELTIYEKNADIGGTWLESTQKSGD